MCFNCDNVLYYLGGVFHKKPKAYELYLPRSVTEATAQVEAGDFEVCTERGARGSERRVEHLRAAGRPRLTLLSVPPSPGLRQALRKEQGCPAGSPALLPPDAAAPALDSSVDADSSFQSCHFEE